MKHLLKLSFAVLMAVAGLAITGCENEEPPTPVVVPEIGVNAPQFDKASMTLKVLVIPSSDVKEWYWSFTTDGEAEQYNKETSAAAKELSRSVEWGKTYTAKVYTLYGDNQRVERQVEYTPMPDAAAVAIGDITLDEATMKASAVITPSEPSEQWGWRAYNGSKEPDEWTIVKGNTAESITFDYTWGETFKVEAYAENARGKSDSASREFYAEPEMATVTIEDYNINSETMTVTFLLTFSKTTVKWGASVNGGEYDILEGNQEAEYSATIKYDTEYTFRFKAWNAVDKGEDKSVDVYLPSPLATINVASISAYTIDVDVSISSKCARYAAGAVLKSAYEPNTFIEQALSSLNVDPAYPFMTYNTATESRSFSEQDLVRNTLADKEYSSGIALHQGQEYTIAVYAENSEGKGDVYTVDVTVPHASIGTSTSVDIVLNDEQISLNAASATVDITTEAKVLVGILDYISTDSDTPFTFESASDQEAKAYIASVVSGVPHIQKSMSEEYMLSNNLDIDTTYVAYAVAIVDGEIGVDYQIFNTKAPSLSGKATIEAATIAEQTSHETLEVTLTASANAQKVRLYAAPTNDHAAYADNLEYVMDASEYQNYREEYEYDGTPITVTVDVYHPGDNYYLYAVAVDEEGRAGAMVNVARLAGLDTDYVTTIEEVIDENSINLNGTGEVDMTVDIVLENEYQVDANFTITYASDNIDTVWIFRLNACKTSEIKDRVSSTFENFPTNSVGAKRIATDGSTHLLQYMEPYDNTYGGTIVMAIVLDTNGKYNISKCYVVGKGFVEI